MVPQSKGQDIRHEPPGDKGRLVMGLQGWLRWPWRSGGSVCLSHSTRRLLTVCIDSAGNGSGSDDVSNDYNSNSNNNDTNDDKSNS